MSASQSRGRSDTTTSIWHFLCYLIQAPLPEYKSELRAVHTAVCSALENSPSLENYPLPIFEKVFGLLRSQKIIREKEGWDQDETDYVGSPTSTIRSKLDDEIQLSYQDPYLEWNLKELGTLMKKLMHHSKLKDRCYCLYCSLQLEGVADLVKHLQNDFHISMVISNFTLRSSMPCHCGLCDLQITSFEGFKSHLRGNSHFEKLIEFFGIPFCVLCDVYYKDGLEAHQRSSKHVERAQLTRNRNQSRSHADFTWDGIEGTVSSAWDRIEKQRELVKPDKFLDTFPGDLFEDSKDWINVSDPCGGGSILQMTAGTVTEIMFRLENYNSFPIEVADVKFFFLDSHDPNIITLGIVRSSNDVVPSNGKGGFTLCVTFREPGYFEFYMVLIFDRTHQVIRHIRFYVEDPIPLNQFLQEIPRLPIHLTSKVESKFGRFTSETNSADSRSDQYVLATETQVLASLSDEEDSLLSALSTIRSRKLNKKKN